MDALWAWTLRGDRFCLAGWRSLMIFARAPDALRRSFSATASGLIRTPIASKPCDFVILPGADQVVCMP